LLVLTTTKVPNRICYNTSSEFTTDSIVAAISMQAKFRLVLSDDPHFKKIKYPQRVATRLPSPSDLSEPHKSKCYGIFGLPRDPHNCPAGVRSLTFLLSQREGRERSRAVTPD
jgi:hypothetical protein